MRIFLIRSKENFPRRNLGSEDLILLLCTSKESLLPLPSRLTPDSLSLVLVCHVLQLCTFVVTICSRFSVGKTKPKPEMSCQECRVEGKNDFLQHAGSTLVRAASMGLSFSASGPHCWLVLDGVGTGFC